MGSDANDKYYKVEASIYGGRVEYQLSKDKGDFMMDPKDRALDYLKSYKSLDSKAQYLRERCLVLRAKAESAVAHPPADGWTGLWEGRCKMTNKKIRVSDPDLVKKPKKVMIRIEGKKQGGAPTSDEPLLCALADIETQYAIAVSEREVKAQEIASKIDAACEADQAMILKQMYLNDKNFVDVSKLLEMSYSHTRRLHFEALEKLGRFLNQQKMSTNEHK